MTDDVELKPCAHCGKNVELNIRSGSMSIECKCGIQTKDFCWKTHINPEINYNNYKEVKQKFMEFWNSRA